MNKLILTLKKVVKQALNVKKVSYLNRKAGFCKGTYLS